MKVVLEFQLPREEGLYRLAQNGAAAHQVLGELRRLLRALQKDSIHTVGTDDLWVRLHAWAQDSGLTLEDWC